MSKTVIAKHAIHGVPGFGVVSPNTVFECPAEVYESLMAAGAIENFVQPEIAVARPAEAAAPAKASSKKAKADDDNGLE